MEFSEPEEVLREFNVHDDGTGSTPEGWKPRGKGSWRRGKAEGVAGADPWPGPTRSSRRRLRATCNSSVRSFGSSSAGPAGRPWTQRWAPSRTFRTDVKDQEIQTLQAELEATTKELRQKMEPVKQESCTAAPSAELQVWCCRRSRRQICRLSCWTWIFLTLQRRKNEELREKNWSAMEALSSTTCTRQRKPSTAAVGSQIRLEMSQECGELLQERLHGAERAEAPLHKPLRTFETLKGAAATWRTEGSLQRGAGAAYRWSRSGRSETDQAAPEAELERPRRKSAPYAPEVGELKGLLTGLQTVVDGVLIGVLIIFCWACHCDTMLTSDTVPSFQSSKVKAEGLWS